MNQRIDEYPDLLIVGRNKAQFNLYGPTVTYFQTLITTLYDHS